MDKKIEKLIYRSFDDELTPEEKRELEGALDESEITAAEVKSIRQMRGILSGMKAGKFSPGFSDRVMESIKKGKMINGHLLYSVMMKQFRNVAIAASLLITLIISFNFLSSGEVSINSALGIEDSTMELAFDPVRDFLGD